MEILNNCFVFFLIMEFQEVKRKALTFHSILELLTFFFHFNLASDQE